MIYLEELDTFLPFRTTTSSERSYELCDGIDKSILLKLVCYDNYFAPLIVFDQAPRFKFWKMSLNETIIC